MTNVGIRHKKQAPASHIYGLMTGVLLAVPSGRNGFSVYHTNAIVRLGISVDYVAGSVFGVVVDNNDFVRRSGDEPHAGGTG